MELHVIFTFFPEFLCIFYVFYNKPVAQLQVCLHALLTTILSAGTYDIQNTPGEQEGEMGFLGPKAWHCLLEGLRENQAKLINKQTHRIYGEFSEFLRGVKKCISIQKEKWVTRKNKSHQPGPRVHSQSSGTRALSCHPTPVAVDFCLRETVSLVDNHRAHLPQVICSKGKDSGKAWPSEVKMQPTTCNNYSWNI